MTNYAQHERAALCDLFESVGPDALTLCEGWSTRDLAAHLVTRESRPDAALGIVLKPFRRYSESVRRKLAAKPWTELVARVRSGPPSLSPMHFEPVDRFTNTIEFFVHHEDVRRAQNEFEPRTLDSGFEEALTRMLGRTAKMMTRRAPAGLVLVDSKGSPVTAKSGTPTVEVKGPIGELVMFVNGRQHAARVEMTGPAELVAAMRDASFGI